MSDEKVARLLELQEIDMEIVSLEERREEIPRRRAEAAREITELENEQSELEEALERARLDRRERESQLETQRKQLDRYESQLNDVKTNVAYSALLTEIQGTKREIGELENEILDLMEDREEHEERLEKIAGELEEKREAASEELEALAREEEEIEDEFVELREHREQLASEVDSRLRQLYQRLRRRRRFPALVPLRGQACSACFGRMPPQVVREITHDGALHPCEACGALVYAEPSESESTGPAGAERASESADAR